MASIGHAVRQAILGLLQQDKEGKIEIKKVRYELEVRQDTDDKGNIEKFPRGRKKMIITYDDLEDK